MAFKMRKSSPGGRHQRDHVSVIVNKGKHERLNQTLRPSCGASLDEVCVLIKKVKTFISDKHDGCVTRLLFLSAPSSFISLVGIERKIELL